MAAKKSGRGGERGGEAGSFVGRFCTYGARNRRVWGGECRRIGWIQLTRLSKNKIALHVTNRVTRGIVIMTAVI